jgi:hypothetical protein
MHEGEVRRVNARREALVEPVKLVRADVRRQCMMVGTSASNSEALSQLSIALGSRLANIDMRLGTQSGALRYAPSNTTPLRARRSRLEVIAARWPLGPIMNGVI